MTLDALQPELIGGLFGRSPSIIGSSRLQKFQAITRAFLLALASMVIFLILAGIDGGLESKASVTPAIILLVSPEKSPRDIGLALLQDPVALIVLVMVLATPVFCAGQVGYIQGFIGMNERNIGYRIDRLDTASINENTASANQQYRRIGGRLYSVGLLIFSAVVSYLLDLMFSRFGLLASWNTSDLPRRSWTAMVYAGWWANPHHHRVLAVALWLLGIYFFYYLSKQLAMGYIFATYVQSILRFDFGVSPNMRHNTDGHWGLRPLRHFMQWTYISTLGHFVLTLGVFLVWLPFNQWTVLIEFLVMVINFIVVIYPSVLAMRGAVREKLIFVEQTIASRRPRSERDATIATVWETPNLPFHIRSTLTAGTVYLLCPLLLALVSALLTR